MEPVTAQINLRPVRVGFLVDPNDRPMLSKVLRLTTCMWGGQMCPLIPVMKRIPNQWKSEWERLNPRELTRGYLRFFEPDVFVETRKGQLATAGLMDGDFNDRERYRSFDQLICKDHGLAADLDLGVNMWHVYSHLFRSEFQFQKREQPRIYRFNRGEPQEEAFFEAAYGYFPRGKTLDYLPKFYDDALTAQAVKPTFEQWREIAERGAGFPLYYTVRDIETSYAGRGDPTIFIFDPLNPCDVIDFWNFRIFTRDVLPVNSRWLKESRDTILKFVRANYRPLPTNPNGIMIRTAIHVARSLNAESVAAQLNLEGASLPKDCVSLQDWYERIWRVPDGARVFSPIAGVLSVKSREVQLVPSDASRAIIRFPIQSPEFDSVMRGKGPGWINTVQIRQYGSDLFANALPSAALGGRVGYPVFPFGQQFYSREGHVTFQNYASDDHFLTLPRRQAAIIAWLETEGFRAVPSEAGRIADQVIAAVDGLGGVDLFRERNVVELLDKMARSRRDWPDGSSDEFQDSTAKVRTWDAALRKTHGKGLSGSWKTLDRYVDAGVLRLGLTAPCSHCGKQNWYSLDDVATTVPCARCLKRFSYPQGRSRDDAWRYRVVGPFATPHYAEGSYSVALTLRFLEREISSIGEFTYSTGLELTRCDQKIEADFFAWQTRQAFGRTSSDPITLIGECKSFGEVVFKPKEVARMKSLALAFPGAFLVASVLKDAFSSGEQKHLRSLAEWGWKQRPQTPLIVLTGVELFGEGPFSLTWKKAGGQLATVGQRHQNIFDFDALAVASQEAHLGFDHAGLMDLRYRRARPPTTKTR